MHDILLRYYGTQLKDRSTSHSTLYKQLGAYKTWERYEWLWCIWHLKEAGEFEDTVTLLTDYHWISGKLNATGSVYEIAKDY
ncbi:MAG: hypothetical protein ABIN89_04990, partial [Chitinophagaceae bacterium]